MARLTAWLIRSSAERPAMGTIHELFPSRAESEDEEGHDQFMQAHSFTYRHFTGVVITSLAMITGFIAIFGYFMVNGNMLDHSELTVFMFGLGFGGIFLFHYTFVRLGNRSRPKAVMSMVGIYAFLGVITFLVSMVPPIIF